VRNRLVLVLVLVMALGTLGPVMSTSGALAQRSGEAVSAVGERTARPPQSPSLDAAIDGAGASTSPPAAVPAAPPARDPAADSAADPPTTRPAPGPSQHWRDCTADASRPGCEGVNEDHRVVRFNELNGSLPKVFAGRLSYFTLDLALDATGKAVRPEFTVALRNPTEADEKLLKRLAPRDAIVVKAARASVDQKRAVIRLVNEAREAGETWAAPVRNVRRLVDADPVEIEVFEADASARAAIAARIPDVDVTFVDVPDYRPEAPMLAGHPSAAQFPAWGGQTIKKLENQRFDCTMGFQATRNSDNGNVYVTAAHCLDESADKYLGLLPDIDSNYVGSGSNEMPKLDDGDNVVDATRLENEHGLNANFANFDGCVYYRGRDDEPQTCRQITGSTGPNDDLGEVVYMTGANEVNGGGGFQERKARRGRIVGVGHITLGTGARRNTHLTAIQVLFQRDETDFAKGLLCGGDSGGPLYEPRNDGTTLLLGITSAANGEDVEGSCGNYGYFEDIFDIQRKLDVKPVGETFDDSRALAAHPEYQNAMTTPWAGTKHEVFETSYGHRPTGTFTSAGYDGSGLNVRLQGNASDADQPGAPVEIEVITSDLHHVTTVSGAPNFNALVNLPPALVGKTLCAWAHDIERYVDTFIGCILPTSVPFGTFEATQGQGLNQFKITGWAIQPGVATARVRVTVDGYDRGTYDASGVRNDVAATVGLGANHGFSPVIAMSAGKKNVCITAVNQLGAGGEDRLIGCREIDNNNPVGSFDQVVRVSPTEWKVIGWAVDPNSYNGAVNVHAYRTGQAEGWVLGAANVFRQDLRDTWQLPATSQFTGLYGGYHGYAATMVNVPVGPAELCTHGLNVAGTLGANALLGCQAIGTTEQGTPVGSFDTVTNLTWKNGAPVYSIAGWAIDPDSLGAVNLHAHWVPVSGASEGYALAPANTEYAGVSTAYPAYGGAHGFNFDMPPPSTPGSYQLCVYALNLAGPGTTKTVGCKAVESSGHNPMGRLDSVKTTPTWTAAGAALEVKGWTADPDTVDPITAHIYVDGVLKTVGTANATRNDLESAHPGFGTLHGFNLTVPLPAFGGNHTICAYGINVGAGTGNSTLNCITANIANGHNPSGGFDAVSGVQWANGAPVYRAVGWAVDPNTTSTTTVHLYVDGSQVATGTTGTAAASRLDISALFAGYGDNRGFDIAIPMPAAAGNHSVCAYAINTGWGSTNTTLGCKTFATSHDPFGAVDSVTSTRIGTAVAVNVKGWAIDPDTDESVSVHIYIDGVSSAHTANAARDLSASFPGFSGFHGYDRNIAVTAGTHTVCVYAINQGSGTNNTTLGCRTLNVT